MSQANRPHPRKVLLNVPLTQNDLPQLNEIEEGELECTQPEQQLQVEKVVYCRDCKTEDGRRVPARMGQCREEGNPNFGRKFYVCNSCSPKFWETEDGKPWKVFNRTPEMEKARRDRKRAYEESMNNHEDSEMTPTINRLLMKLSDLEYKLDQANIFVREKLEGCEERLKKLCTRFNMK